MSSRHTHYQRTIASIFFLVILFFLIHLLTLAFTVLQIHITLDYNGIVELVEKAKEGESCAVLFLLNM